MYKKTKIGEIIPSLHQVVFRNLWHHCIFALSSSQLSIVCLYTIPIFLTLSVEFGACISHQRWNNRNFIWHRNKAVYSLILRSCMERRNVVCPCDREVSSLTILDKFAGIRTSYLGSADDMISHVKRKVTGRNFSKRQIGDGSSLIHYWIFCPHQVAHHDVGLHPFFFSADLLWLINFSTYVPNSDKQRTSAHSIDFRVPA